MAKTAEQYLESVRDGRQVYLDGEIAGDVTIHPAYRNVVATVAGLYDFVCRPENQELMTYPTGDGGRANRIWQLPHSYQELVTRRRSLGRDPWRLPGPGARSRGVLHCRNVYGDRGVRGI